MRKIVIAHRGWVFVGDFSKEGNEIVLSNASVIRVWGTSKGIGQLAIEGKQPGTVLDACGTVRMNELAAIGMIDVTSNL